MKNKKIFLVLVFILLLSFPCLSFSENIGSQGSFQLVNNAWQAYDQDDLDAVLMYTDQCINRYGKTAQRMQGRLTDYPDGEKKSISSFWALNDVSTAYYIKADSLRKAGRVTDAQPVFQELIDKFYFGQCWDSHGWYWSPAEAAKQRLVIIEENSPYDFDDLRSQALVLKAWQALSEKDFDAVLAYTNKCIEFYSIQAREMQESLSQYPLGRSNIFNYWALNDVATAYFIQAEVLRATGKVREAKKAYRELVSEYRFGQCWDPKGWFWKPAQAAEEKLHEIYVKGK
ncbi:tetratricopeptide repeat protein [Candidatus Omnitrophota bacterium]